MSPDVLRTSAPAVRAAKQATTTISNVFWVAFDVIEQGLVAGRSVRYQHTLIQQRNHCRLEAERRRQRRPANVKLARRKSGTRVRGISGVSSPAL